MPNADKPVSLREILDLPSGADQFTRLAMALADAVASLSEQNSEVTGEVLERLRDVNKDLKYVRDNLHDLQTKVKILSDRFDVFASQVMTKH